MTTYSTTATPPVRRPEFQPRHPWDSWFFPAMVAIFWVGVVMGFGSDVLTRAKAGPLSFPPIIHVHAAAFMGWMVFLSVQVALIRNGRPDLHRKLGVAGLGLVVLMLILGPAAALTSQVARFGKPGGDPAFLAIQLGSLINFVGLVAAAVVNRANSPLHKRLILLATLTIVDAGFARWVGPSWGPLLGPLLQSSFWTNYLIDYGVTAPLMLGVGAYDLVTRGRLLPGYVIGLVWAMGWQLVIIAAYLNPGWGALTKAFIGGMAGH